MNLHRMSFQINIKAKTYSERKFLVFLKEIVPTVTKNRVHWVLRILLIYKRTLMVVVHHRIVDLNRSYSKGLVVHHVVFV